MDKGYPALAVVEEADDDSDTFTVEEAFVTAIEFSCQDESFCVASPSHELNKTYTLETHKMEASPAPKPVSLLPKLKETISDANASIEQIKIAKKTGKSQIPTRTK